MAQRQNRGGTLVRPYQTNKVRFWKTEIRKGKRGQTYHVVWKVDKERFKEVFTSIAAADGFRSDLLVAHRGGVPFNTDTGRPVTWKQNRTPSWYSFACSYVDAKWAHISPNHRRGIAEALTDTTEAFIKPLIDRPNIRAIRLALRQWAFSVRAREGGEPPPEHKEAIDWLKANTVEMSRLEQLGDGPLLIRAALDRISRKTDGSLAAPNTTIRKRTALNSALEFGVEIGLLTKNPLQAVKWSRPKTEQAVDPAVVVNPEQAERLLGAIGAQGELGKRLVAFFACMYHAALRPEEAIDIRIENLRKLPDTGWGEMRLTHAEPRSGTAWTDDGASRQRRQLKHRAIGASRVVPIHPELVRILRRHLATYPVTPGNRIFQGPRGGMPTSRAYLKVWHPARARAFTPSEAASPMARVPYDLRHACVSTWLAAGVQPPRIAEWAGHSVKVLLEVYAKCIAGQEEQDMQKILATTTALTTISRGQIGGA